MDNVNQCGRRIGNRAQHYQHRDRFHWQAQRSDDKDFTEECPARYAADDNGGEHRNQHGQEEGLGGELHAQHGIDKDNFQRGNHRHATFVQVNQ